MSHRTIATAWAIALVLTSALPATLASHAPEYVTILSPENGATIAPDARVRVQFDTGHYSGPVLVEALLNGTVVGQVITFAQPMPVGTPSNGTRVEVRINASSIPGGFYDLTARANASNATLVSAPVGVLLNRAPTVAVRANYDLDRKTLHVLGNFSDERPGVTLRLASPLGNATLSTNGTTFEYEQQGALARGDYVVEVFAQDSEGAVGSAKAIFTVADRPTTFEILKISALHGERFHVHGRVSDDDGPVRSVSVATRFGGGSSDVHDGMFWIDFPIRGLVGVHQATLWAADATGGKTNVTAPFEIQGVERVFYEKEVQLDAGANVAVSDFRLPERSYGQIALCSVVGDGCIRPDALRRGAAVVEIAHHATDLDSRRCTLADTLVSTSATTSSCTFDARSDGTFGRLAWGTAGSGRFRVTVSGYELT